MPSPTSEPCAASGSPSPGVRDRPAVAALPTPTRDEQSTTVAPDPGTPRCQDTAPPHACPPPRILTPILPPPAGLHHSVHEDVFDGAYLRHYLSAVRLKFNPQTVSYDSTSYNATRWSISCFLEYEKGVAMGKIAVSRDLLALSRPLLTACDSVFAAWRQRGAGHRYGRVQSFVTRYRAVGLETHLPKHIDGGDVDGSLILALPTDAPYQGGGLTVWDGPDPRRPSTFVHPLPPGSVCLLGPQVWHQSNPITSGERWVLVVFYRRIDGAPAGALPAHAARTALGNRLRAALSLRAHGEASAAAKPWTADPAPP